MSVVEFTEIIDLLGVVSDPKAAQLDKKTTSKAGAKVLDSLKAGLLNRLGQGPDQAGSATVVNSSAMAAGPE